MAKTIRVLQHFNQYNPGEIATFADAVAADIIKRGLGAEVQVDRKGNIIPEVVPNAADKPIGDPAPAFTDVPEGSTTADAPTDASTPSAPQPAA